MRRRRRLHYCRQPRRHALERRVAAGEHVHWQKHQQIEQAELRHRSRDRAEENADGGRKKQINRDAEEEQRDRPAIGTPSKPWTTKQSDRPTATMMTRPFAQIFDIAISNGVSGMTRRWSIVPCSRSRTTAAPARIIASIVMLLMMPITLVNRKRSVRSACR